MVQTAVAELLAVNPNAFAYLVLKEILREKHAALLKAPVTLHHADPIPSAQFSTELPNVLAFLGILRVQTLSEVVSNHSTLANRILVDMEPFVMLQEALFVIALDRLLVIPSNNVPNLFLYKSYVDLGHVVEMLIASSYKTVNNATADMATPGMHIANAKNPPGLFAIQTHAVRMPNVLSRLTVKVCVFALKGWEVIQQAFKVAMVMNVRLTMNAVKIGHALASDVKILVQAHADIMHIVV